MKTRIETERRRAGLDLAADLKEGPGGIRDVEFLIQALQLFHGGRHPEIRTGNVLETLTAFARLDLLPRQAVQRLRDSYLWLRQAEHCVQMVEERQVCRFPRDPAAQLGLARRMGYDEVDGELARERLVENWTSTRAEVRAQFNKLVLESEPAESLAPRLEQHLEGTPLLPRFSLFAEPFLRRHVASEHRQQLSEGAARGLARVLASNLEIGRYLAHRPALVDRIFSTTPDAVEARIREIESRPHGPEADDLEEFLNQLRLFRRDETTWIAALDLSDQLPFETVSYYLSIVAEACVRWALVKAGEQLGLEATPDLSVIGMGRVAGREMTYHSDLDLIFLYPDGARDSVEPSRIAQRLIAYLTTMTGAGVAYQIDSRLRPSGRQGALVSNFSAFREYQAERAALWEHLALMRARTIAGQIEPAQRVLEDAQRSALGVGRSAWPEIAEMRQRVEQERAREREQAATIPFKTGRGGLMDVEFLASGAMLERAAALPEGELPSIPALLRAGVSGRRVEALLRDCALLRRLGARSRLVMGRSVEQVSLGDESAECIAELMEPGLSVSQLAEQVESARADIRSAFTDVCEAGSISALEG
jgi:glutamate-ammonia-ligase adenylyltransferase